MYYERFIARRYLRSGRHFISVATWISVLGVALGVATVCIVMSLSNGFETEIRSRLLGTTSHVSIFPLRGELIEDYRELVEKAETVEGVKAASAFIYFKAAIASISSGDGLIVRGIDLEAERRTSNIEDDLKIGEYTFEPEISDSDTVPGMILGSHVAERLGVFLGEPVWLYSLNGEDLHRRARPRVSKFYVSAIFETGMYEFDAQMGYVSLADAQELFKTGDAATAVHLKLDNVFLAEPLAPIIDSVLDYRYDVVPWNVLHRNLFSWIEIEKLVLFVGFVLIIVVAAFSIISTLVMLTMEKRPEIGILKTIGVTPGSIRKVFVLQGVTIGSIGVVAGWLLALAVTYLQNRFELIALPPEIYFISYLPLETRFLDFTAVGLVAFVVTFLAALYPASQAARLTVTDVLRQ
ncbi:MAG: ABC transporter permease [bacterium]